MGANLTTMVLFSTIGPYHPSAMTSVPEPGAIVLLLAGLLLLLIIRRRRHHHEKAPHDD